MANDPKAAAEAAWESPSWKQGAREYRAMTSVPLRAETKRMQAAPWHFHSESKAEPTAWLVKGILPETGAGLISGQWGSYKTTVALDIAVSVMAEVPFAGRFKVKRRGGVCYIAAEGFGGLASRLTAAANTRGVSGALPFAFRSDCPPLAATDALEKLIALVDEATAQIENTFNLPLVLVIIDTVITTAGYAKSGDDNDTAIAQRVMSVLSGLSRHTCALVIGVDHFGKSAETGTRGSSAKEGHADVVLAMLADRELNGTVTNTRLAIRKHREGISGLELPFAPKVVALGSDDDGDPITRVVIDWNAAAVRPTESGWSKSLQLLRRILMACLAGGVEMQPFLDGPVVRAVAITAVRAEFDKQYFAEGTERQKADTRRQAFKRAIADAQGKRLIAMREVNGCQMVWLTKAADEADA